MSEELRLTWSVVETTVLEHARRNDVLKLQELIKDIDAAQMNEPWDALMETLLTNDFVEMAEQCLSPEDIDDWICDRVEHVATHWPKLFVQWARPSVLLVQELGDVFVKLTTPQKIQILRGEGATPAQAFLWASLRDEPSYWGALSPAWLGVEGSPLRRAATDLGWSAQMVPAMVRRFIEVPFASWSFCFSPLGDVFKYPYSVACSVALMDHPNNGPLANSNAYGPTNKHVPVHCEEHANPKDVMLGQMLLGKTPFCCSLVLHPDSTVPSEQEVRELERTVELHVSLGCIDVLVHSLINGVIPGGEAVVAGEVVALPNLDPLLFGENGP